MTRTLLAVCALALIVPAGMAQNNNNNNNNFTFRLEAQGIPAVVFSKCSGIATQSEVLEFRDGSGGPTVKAPGATKYPNVVCSRPLSSDNTLSDWRKLVEGGQNFRKSFTITLFDRNRVVKAWSFVRGWPVKWQLNELDASKNEVAIETLEIAHEGLSFSP